MKNKKYFYAFVIFNCLQIAVVLYLFFVHQQTLSHENEKIAARFLLTDPCLNTESRHLRHFSLAEPLAAFQDLPAWHEHFPASSFFYYQIQQP